MRLKSIAAAFAALFLGFTPAAAKLPLLPIVKTATLPVPLLPQLTNVWCWAASGDMVMTYCGHPHAQCEQASYQFAPGQPSNYCCQSPLPSICHSGGQVEILHYGFTASQLGNNSALTGPQIVTQISTLHMPWIANPHSPGWGHVIVGVGYVSFDGVVLWVAINDPWPPNTGATYIETLAFYQCGGWEGNCHTEGYDFYNIKPPPLAVPKPPLLAELPFKYRPPEVERILAGDPDPVTAAKAALPLLAQSVDDRLAAQLGVGAADRIGRAVLGKPVEQYTVPLERLQAWKPGGRADDLLVKDRALLVPVSIDGEPRAVMHLQFDGTNWHVATFGAAPVAQAWAKARGEFYVHVDGLEETFAGRRVDGAVLLTPLFADRVLGLAEGREQPAAAVFDRLAAPARTHVPNILVNKRVQ